MPSAAPTASRYRIAFLLALIAFNGLTCFVMMDLAQALLSSARASNAVRIGTVVLALFAGLMAYGMRQTQRVKYAAAEITFGVWGAWYATALQDDKAAIMAFFGAVYVIVRGIDNFVTGYPDAQEDIDVGATALKGIVVGAAATEEMLEKLRKREQGEASASVEDSDASPGVRASDTKSALEDEELERDTLSAKDENGMEKREMSGMRE